ncbi:MAG: TRAP transporter substrate-binding protein [Syntrophales bacterium]
MGRKFFVRVSFTAVLFVMMTFLPQGVLAGPTVLKMSFYQPPSHLFFKLAEQHFPQVEKLTQGRVRFQLYHSSTLCPAEGMLEYVNSGLAFAALPCNAYFSKTFPVFDIDSIGVYTNGILGMYEAYRGGLDQLINNYLRAKGLKNLIYAGATSFSGHNPAARIPINTPADFKGLKVRALGQERYIVEQGGGASVSFPMGQVYEGLQRGIIDSVWAQETNWIDWKLQEQVKYINFVDLTTAPMAVVYNENIMKKLSADDQKVVKEAISSYLELMHKETMAYDKNARQWLTSKWSGKATYPTKAQKAEWTKAAKGARDLFLKANGDIAQKALSIVDKFNPIN